MNCKVNDKNLFFATEMCYKPVNIKEIFGFKAEVAGQRIMNIITQLNIFLYNRIYLI